MAAAFPTPCPVPDVDRALLGYINSRQETLRIRAALSKYLLSAANGPNSGNIKSYQHLDHQCPNQDTAKRNPPSHLNHTRIDYHHALEDLARARTRHKELQAALEDLWTSHLAEASAQTHAEYDVDVTRSYVSLLQQRRRCLELQVIQESVEKLMNAYPADSHKDPRTLVKQAIGEQPDLPVERLELLSGPEGDQTWVFKLKKEVLDARAKMDRANTARIVAQQEKEGSPSLSHQVYALGHARDDMVAWVEEELSKLNEESEFLEDASPVKRPANHIVPDIHSSEDHIRQGYEGYTASRSRLLDVHEASSRIGTASSSLLPEPLADPPSAAQALLGTQSSKFIVDIICQLPQLTQMSNSERSILQQAVYLKALLSSADEELTEALSRLSEESRLLPSGSKNLLEWGAIACEAEKAVRGFANEERRQGHQEASSVAAMLDLCSLQSEVLAFAK
ncbi:hypothetical protein P154DRAFT_225577 [Amniculicola lignicola CBS 123094]|uniref:Uncharacterized protein n=1 Tax=Amniculicola lignicola CBS 123094 TaxID=1392246 RepID=A0A6A5WGY3_9PLEO|nr:hypothetical protein P154DRAFT_225577 [Amniculicola lignicola CBS 123094]